MNANLTFRTIDDLWLAALSCDNCTDESNPQSTLSNFSYLNPPRSWNFRVSRSF